MKEQLNLLRTIAHEVSAAVDERRSEVAGYYTTHEAAIKNSKKIGWYGSDGQVRAIEVYTDGQQLYEVKPLGQYTDVVKEKKEKMSKSIKSKLSEEEWNYLLNNKVD